MRIELVNTVISTMPITSQMARFLNMLFTLMPHFPLFIRDYLTSF